MENELKARNLISNHNFRAYMFLTITTWCWGANAILGKVAVGDLSGVSTPLSALVNLRNEKTMHENPRTTPDYIRDCLEMVGLADPLTWISTVT